MFQADIVAYNGLELEGQMGPAGAARQWTNRLEVMVALAETLGMVSGVVGT